MLSKRDRHYHRAVKTAEAMNILIDKVVGVRPSFNIDGTIRYLKYRIDKQREH